MNRLIQYITQVKVHMPFAAYDENNHKIAPTNIIQTNYLDTKSDTHMQPSYVIITPNDTLNVHRHATNPAEILFENVDHINYFEETTFETIVKLYFQANHLRSGSYRKDNLQTSYILSMDEQATNEMKALNKTSKANVHINKLLSNSIITPQFGNYISVEPARYEFVELPIINQIVPKTMYPMNGSEEFHLSENDYTNVTKSLNPLLDSTNNLNQYLTAHRGQITINNQHPELSDLSNMLVNQLYNHIRKVNNYEVIFNHTNPADIVEPYNGYLRFSNGSHVFIHPEQINIYPELDKFEMPFEHNVNYASNNLAFNNILTLPNILKQISKNQQLFSIQNIDHNSIANMLANI